MTPMIILSALCMIVAACINAGKKNIPAMMGWIAAYLWLLAYTYK